MSSSQHAWQTPSMITIVYYLLHFLFASGLNIPYTSGSLFVSENAPIPLKLVEFLLPLFLIFGAWELHYRYVLNNTNSDQQTVQNYNPTGNCQQQGIFEAYCGQMNYLIQSHLRTSKPRDKERTIARTHTLSALRNLDNNHKAQVLQFLYNSGLIHNENPIVNLARVDLNGAHLGGVYLVNVDLSFANLNGTNLFSANLANANLDHASLSYANMNHINLSGGHLNNADLTEADLRGANLHNTNLTSACLRQGHLPVARLTYATLDRADLSYANLPHTNLYGASLQNANLAHANLTCAYLQDANLTHINLSYANLTGAYFRNVNLYGANLCGADLARTTLVASDLTAARYDRNTTWPSGFDPLRVGATRIDATG